MILYQIFFITIILISSFFGLSTFLFVVFFSLLFTFANVFTPSLLIIQSSVIIFSSIFGLAIATVVSLLKAAEKGNLKKLLKDITTEAFWLAVLFIVIKINKLLLIVLILACLIISNIKTIIKTIPSIKNFFTHSIKPSPLKDDINKVTHIKSSIGDMRYGLVDKRGRVIVKPIYRGISEIKNNSAILKSDTGYSTVDVTSGIIRELPYSYVSLLSSNGYFSVSQNNYKGIIKSNGDIIVECIYDSINDSSSVFDTDISFTVCKDNKYGLIDYKGDFILNLEYDYISDFSYKRPNVAVIKKNGLYRLINSKGEFISNLEYDYISDFSSVLNNFAVVKKNQLYGLIDVYGNIVLPLIYDNITNSGKYKNSAIATQNNKNFKINYRGEII